MISKPSASTFVAGDFPAFYNSEGPLFLAFIKAYYQWMELQGNPLGDSQAALSYRDIDNTLNSFITHFQNEYMSNIPQALSANPRLLLKHIVDLYRAKGSDRGYELLFRILFNEDIKVYIPNQYIFKPSDNQWIRKNYIEVTNFPNLGNLVGLQISTSSDPGVTAIVEDFDIISIGNKVVNVLYISNATGAFKYGDFILSKDYPTLTPTNSPTVVGSMVGAAIITGGALFNVGDIVNVTGSGKGGLGRVASVALNNGKVQFNLVDGGQGFSTTPNISITSNTGAGATFSIGSLLNPQPITLNSDTINNFLQNSQLDIPASGFSLNITGIVGIFTNGEVVNTFANGTTLDFTQMSSNGISNGEFLSNTALGLTNMKVIFVDNPNCVRVTASEIVLNSANLIGGINLIGATSGANIHINSVMNKVVYHSNATVVSSNTTVLTINNANGYFMPTATINGQTSLATATLSSIVRLTSWTGFANTGNLDSAINTLLTLYIKYVGKIASLSLEFPGTGYANNPTVSVVEQAVYDLRIPDGNGGYWGGDSNITAIAGNTSGIMSGIYLYDAGFGYYPGEPLIFQKAGSPYVASGTAIVDGNGQQAGYWGNKNSFISDGNYLQDSLYYQQFSYEIIAPRALETYKNFITKIIHPVHLTLYGRFGFEDQQNANSTLLMATGAIIS